MSQRETLIRTDDQIAELIDMKARRLAEVVAEAGRDGAVLGLSGGIDSAVALGLAARALGPDRVTAVRLPAAAVAH